MIINPRAYLWKNREIFVSQFKEKNPRNKKIRDSNRDVNFLFKYTM